MELSVNFIEKLLHENLSITFLSVVDESHLHRGHAGVMAAPTSVTHIVIHLSASELDGLTKVRQHQYVYSILKPCFDAGLHSVQFIIN